MHKRKPRHAGGVVFAWREQSVQFRVRRREKPSPARPKASSAKVPGSGTDVGGSIETGINAELVPRTDRLTLLNENEDDLISTDVISKTHPMTSISQPGEGLVC